MASCLPLLLGIRDANAFHVGPALAVPFLRQHGARTPHGCGRGLRAPSAELTCSSAAGGFRRGRQWNGKPVLDTVVLHPHSDIAQPYWASVMEAGDTAVDATCGNGWDTLFLLRSLAAAGGGTLISCDVQALAFEKSQQLLARELEGMMHIEQGRDIWTCSPTDQFQQLLPGVGPVTVRWALEVKLLVLREGGTVTAQCSAPL